MIQMPHEELSVLPFITAKLMASRLNVGDVCYLSSVLFDFLWGQLR